MVTVYEDKSHVNERRVDVSWRPGCECGELGGQEADAEYATEVGLEQPLDLTLQLERRALERQQLVAADLEEVHGLLSGGRDAFLDESDLVVGEAVEVVDETVDATVVR